MDILLTLETCGELGVRGGWVDDKLWDILKRFLLREKVQ